ncbi:MAG: hypothetical protein IPL49_13830 [Saprospirales bacterium]|nr:hypothetical protein [Saprospirales bacterium]
MKKLLPILFLSLLWWNCADDGPTLPENSPVPIEQGTGVYILNEGGFNAGNASIDYFRYADNRLFSGLFAQQNGLPLGDVLQSMTIWKDQAFIVVNNSQKILGVHPDDFIRTATIAPFTSPRYLLPLPSGKAYVTDLFSNFIYRVDLNTQQKLEDSIQVTGWTEEMVRIGGEVFVASRFSNNLYIIDTLTNGVDQMSVDFDPTSLVVDKNGKLWTLCTGDESSSLPGGILCIDPQTRQIEHRFEFPDYHTGVAAKIRINSAGDVLFFLKEAIYRMEIDAVALPTTPLIAANGRNLYSLEIQPSGSEIFTSDAGDFMQRGTVYRYTPDGSEIQFFKAGVNPNGFVFY